MHRFLLHNDRIEEPSEAVLSPTQGGLLSGWGVFSTIRVADGVLFAYERHHERMRRDALKLRVPFPADAEWLRQQLLRLVQANEAWNATLRVSVVRNHGGFWDGPGVRTDYDVIAFTRDLGQWPDEVRLGLKPAARYAQSEFAGTKVLSWAHNLIWYQEAHDRALDEVLLLNERGEVSECTSANVFAVFGDTACTPPLSSGCLPGVTRALLLSGVKSPGIRVVERPLTPTDLESADEVFITSTTRDLLPVKSIEGLSIRTTGTVVVTLAKAIADYRARYVETHSASALMTGNAAQSSV